MSLQVWLPLNGNVNNQGLSGDATISGTLSYASGGKIADKYLNTSNMISIYVPSIKGSKICTFSFWAYVVSSTITSDWTLVARIDDQGTNAGSNMRFEICPKSNYNGIYCFSNHNNGNYGLTNGCITSPTGGYYDQWVHFCFTSDGTTFTRYMNGVKIGTCAYNGQATFNGNFQLANNNKCYKQDVRIYDHCLSAKEVSEIAKGLVLHYQLKGFGQPNLINKAELYTNSTKLTRTASKSDDYIHTSMTVNLTANTTYTISFYTTGAMPNQVELGLMFQNGYNYYKFMNGSYHYKIRDDLYYHNEPFTVANTGSYTIRCDWNISGETHSFWNFKIEEGSKATSWCPNSADLLYSSLGFNSTTEPDCSGFGNNGTKSGSIISNSNSPRYSSSYKFNTGVDYIKSAFTLSMSELSCSFWVKPNSSNGGYSIIASNYNNPPSGFWLAINTEGSGVWFYNGTYVQGASLLTNDVWHHCVFTFKNGIGTWYVNGTSVISTDISSRGKSLSINNLTVGNSYTGTSWNTKNYGYVSDFRFYATALSATDIKELYNSPASIDKSGNLFAYEFMEV